MIFFRAWIVMLAIGALHAHHSGIPAVGYLDTLLGVIALDSAVNRTQVPVTAE